jgi:uncharacterized RDD family membrane protein YckC
MTCQACQTWNGKEEHRCRRCGRRLRATPTRHVREGYPIAATALAYQPDDAEETQPAPANASVRDLTAQQPLFSALNEPRVIPFDQLATPRERESIRARAAQLNRPDPVRSAKVEVSARPRRSRSKTDGQQQFDFSQETEIGVTPRSAIQCGAPVAPPMLRLSAALADSFIVLFAAFLALLILRFATGTIPSGSLAFAAYLTCYVALSLTYKLIWCVAGRDTFGLQAARLRLVDLDGNPPSQRRRFWRAFSGFLSLGAAGLGLIWILADADGLAWHDQISATFPTFVED